MHEQERRASLLVAPHDYERIIATLDESTLESAFVGQYASREAFGQELLADTSAKQRLAELPLWLRDYVKLDGEAFVADLEQQGVYVVAKVQAGVCVFDGAIVKNAF
jgi:hypothetical protein